MELDFWRLNILACCCPENQYSEITGFFLRFQNKKRALRDNESEITGENTFNGDLVKIGHNHESGKDEKTFFRCFCRSATSVLTLRP